LRLDLGLLHLGLKDKGHNFLKVMTTCRFLDVRVQIRVRVRVRVRFRAGFLYC
jgi:hypothetical protein